MATSAPPGSRAFLATVDAFTDHPFGGNPAGVCLLDAAAPEAWMRKVAAEMRHSETAFVHPEGDAFRLRWFTPTREIDLCGHATLASAHTMWERGLAPGKAITFLTRSGPLVCSRTTAGIAMAFPRNAPAPCDPPTGLWEALGIPASPTLLNIAGHLIVVTTAAHVQAVRPDLARIAVLPGIHGVVVTAPSADPSYDYVCRYFVPAFGVDEDPVTGSIQTALGPYWSARLGKSDLRVWQASARGGSMTVQPGPQRVTLVGNAVTVWTGQIQVAPETVLAN